MIDIHGLKIQERFLPAGKAFLKIAWGSTILAAMAFLFLPWGCCFIPPCPLNPW